MRFRRSALSWLPCMKRLAAAWLLMYSALLFAGPVTASHTPLPLYLGGVLLLFTLLTLPSVLLPLSQLEDILLGAGAVAAAVLLVYRYAGKQPYAFCAAVLLALGLLLFPLFHAWRPERPLVPVGKKACVAAVCLCALVFTATVSTVTCLRYASYSAPNFDFGVFSNMFYHMKTSLRPLVSCERDRLLSHFAVHISPIYYVLLPAYALFPSPHTLQIGQALVLASGLLPLYLLSKKYKLSNTAVIALSLVYAGYPALNAGCFYDIHENCFLTPLLLWVFVCYEYGRYRWLYAAAAAVLLVKEDAAVYLAVFAVYLWLARKDRHGKWLLGLALAYFLLAVFLLSRFGDGAMFHRYANLSDGEASLVGIAMTLVRHPGHFLDQLFRSEDGGMKKWLYLFQLLAPLAGLPWITRRSGRYLLLAPLLLNLLPTYSYLYNIGFQYGFGLAAFLLYASVMNLSDLSPLFRRNMLAFSVIASCLLFITAILPRLEGQIAYYRDNRDTFQRMDRVLDGIPREASVTASGMLVARLSARDEIYELAYHERTDTDYLVLDVRGGPATELEEVRERYREAGYALAEFHENLLEIWTKESAESFLK